MPDFRSRSSSARGVAAAVGLVAVLVPTGHAVAHTALVSSSPGDDAALEAPPAEVELVFTEPVSATILEVVVRGPDGADVTAGDPQVAGETVSQALDPLTATGAYYVAYRVVAADGHPVTGETAFTLATAPGAGPADPDATPEVAASTTPPPDPASNGEEAATPAAADGDGPGWLALGGTVALLVAVGAGGAILWSRRSRAGGPG